MLDRLGRLDEAVEKYSAFLEQRPDASNASYVQRRIDISEGLGDGQEAGEGPEPEAEPEPLPDEAPGDTPEPRVEDPGPEAPSRVGRQYGDLEDACPEGRCAPELESDGGDRLRTFALTTDVAIGIAGAAALGGLIWWLAGGDERDDGPAMACGLRGCNARLRF